jgi:hypothetical protein
MSLTSTVQVSHVSCASHVDDVLASSMTPADVIDRLRGLAQRVRLIDDRCDVSTPITARSARPVR